MSVLAILACLVVQQESCIEVRIVAPVGVVQCTMMAAPHVARWMDEHPERLVREWRCVSEGQRAFPQIKIGV